jgi:hypothetical protein
MIMGEAKRRDIPLASGAVWAKPKPRQVPTLEQRIVDAINSGKKLDFAAREIRAADKLDLGDGLLAAWTKILSEQIEERQSVLSALKVYADRRGLDLAPEA